MSVHHAITRHSRKQNAHIEQFLALDQLREQAIEQAVIQQMSHTPFSVESINQLSLEINELAKKGITPTRKLVNPQMIIDYAKTLKR